MKKITKREARKLFSSGQDFIMTPCKCSPYFMLAYKVWSCNYLNEGRSFDDMYDEYCDYNCTSYYGRYPAFYID